MDGILAGPFTPCAIFKHFSTMAYYVSLKCSIGRWNRLHPSTFGLSQETSIDIAFRERHEYKIFRALVDSIPGLEERLVSADELINIAELVRISLFSWPILYLIAHHFGS